MTKAVTLPGYGDIEIDTIKKEDLLDIWQDIIAKTGLEVRTGTRVDRVARNEDGIFDVETSQGNLRAQTVVLALGRRGSPRKLGVPGENLGKVVYRLLEPENYTGKSCLVIGGGDAGVEAAIALGAAGATVHLAHRRKIFDRIKPKNQTRLDEAVASGQVNLLLEAKPLEVRDTTAVVQVGDETQELPNDYVLVFIGGVLPTKFLEAAGVEVKTFKGEAFAPANA